VHEGTPCPAAPGRHRAERSRFPGCSSRVPAGSDRGDCPYFAPEWESRCLVVKFGDYKVGVPSRLYSGGWSFFLTRAPRLGASRGCGGNLATRRTISSSRPRFSSQPSPRAASMKARDCSRSPVSLASDAGDLCFGNVVPLPGGTQATNGPRLDEAPRLRFESPNDAMDFARKSVEQSRRWLAARDLTVAQRYKQGHAHLTIIVEASSGMHPSKLELLLCAIPTVYKVAWPFNDERIAIRGFYKMLGTLMLSLRTSWCLLGPEIRLIA
jgi:hypothetical protein